MERIICFLVLISFSTSCFADLECTPKLKQMDNLDSRKAVGKWYVSESKTKSSGFRNVLNFTPDALADCPSFNLTIDETNKSVNLTFYGVQTRPRKQFERTLTGPFTGKGNTVVSAKVDNKTTRIRITIISTDYDDWGIMTGCEAKNKRSIWILNRKPGILSDEMSKKVDDALSAIGESKSIFSGNAFNYCPTN